MIDVEQVMKDWLELNHRRLEEFGMAAVLTLGSQERTPRSAWIDFETSGVMGRIIAWERGDTEVQLVNIRTGEVRRPVYRELQTPSELDEILTLTMRAISVADLPSGPTT